MTPLELLAEQLWAPALSSSVRLAVNPAPSREWHGVEAYRAVPTPGTARLLLPAARRPMVSSLDNYRGLRRPRENLARRALASAGRAGLLSRLPRVTVQVHVDHLDARSTLPLPMLAAGLGRKAVHASIGVRTGANRKATLQLVDDTGTPVGYAKFGWNRQTDEYVHNEWLALSSLAPGPSAMRAPRALARFDYFGHPVVVTEPLPGDATACDASQPIPPPQEMFSLCRLHRSGPVSSSSQFQEVRKRLEQLRDVQVVTETSELAMRLADLVARQDVEVPLTSMWHGDLTPWNCAREPNGQLWAWDWESSEIDAVGGLDAIHWAFSTRRLTFENVGAIDLADCLHDARLHLTATGMAYDDQPIVSAVYAVTVAERAATLAAREGTWRRVWIQPPELARLLKETEHMMTAP